MGQLRQLTVPVQVGAGIARVAQIGLAAAHQRADSSGAHAGQRLLPQCLLEHIAVGTEQRLFQKSLLFAGDALVVLLLKAALDDAARTLRGFPPAACAAHAIAYQRPCCIAGQLPGTVVILIVLPDASYIRFSCKFHRFLPLFMPCRSFRRGAAGRRRH